MKCPCLKCRNCVFKKIDVVEDHLWVNGVLDTYKIWEYHGEKASLDRGFLDDTTIGDDELDGKGEDQEVIHNDRMEDMLLDVLRGNFMEDPDLQPGSDNIPETNPRAFENLWDEAHCPAYPGCKNYTKLSFVVRLLYYKIRFNWSDNSVNTWLPFLRKLLPDGNT